MPRPPREDEMKRRIAPCALLGALLAVAGPAASQTVYKLIDRSGKVTYVQEPPKDFDGQVIRIDIDPNANKATLNVPKAPAAQPNRELSTPVPPSKGPSREQQLEDARQKLEDAKQALADARDNPREEDMRFIGNAGGGVRRVPTEAYQQRLDALERAVKEAEDEVHRLEKDE